MTNEELGYFLWRRVEGYQDNKGIRTLWETLRDQRLRYIRIAGAVKEMIVAEARKEFGEWLKSRDSVHSPNEYLSHLHIVSHLDIETFLRGEKP